MADAPAPDDPESVAVEPVTADPDGPVVDGTVDLAGCVPGVATGVDTDVDDPGTGDALPPRPQPAREVPATSVSTTRPLRRREAAVRARPGVGGEGVDRTTRPESPMPEV